MRRRRIEKKKAMAHVCDTNNSESFFTIMYKIAFLKFNPNSNYSSGFEFSFSWSENNTVASLIATIVTLYATIPDPVKK